MDFIPEITILKFHPDTLISLRKKYNYEKSQDMNLAIDLLSDWLKKQNHFLKKNYRRDYLERAIIFQKGSLERTKAQIDKICTLRTLLPNFFDDYDPETCLPIINYTFIQTYLPTLTNDNYRIYFAKIVNEKLTSKLIFAAFKLVIIFFEYVKSCDYFDGCILIFDLTELNMMDLIKAMNMVELRQIIIIALDGYAFRVKGIHLITASPAVDLLVKLLKQCFSKKIGNRIHVYKDFETLHAVVDKRLLPKEYGGNEDSLNTLYEAWTEIMCTSEHKEYMKEINNARTDESLRQNNNIYNEYLGISGTFRNLCVD